MSSLDQTKTNEIDWLWWVYDAVNDYDSDQIAITAGYNSGKTVGAIQILLERMAVNHKSKNWFICEPIHRLINHVAIPKFEIAANQKGLFEGKHYRIVKDKANFKIVMFTGQEILLLSAEKPNSLVGFDAAGGIMDEPGVCRKEAKQRLMSRLRDPNAITKPQLILPGTPEGVNFFSEEFDSDAGNNIWTKIHSQDAVAKVYNEQTKRHTQKRRFRPTTYDNKFADDQFIQNIYETYGHNDHYIQSYIFGFFTPFADNLAYSNYKSRLHDLDQEIPVKPEIPIYLTFDFNRSPMAWLLIQQETVGNSGERVHIVKDEASQNSSWIDDAIGEFMDRYPPEQYGNTPIHLYGDRSGHMEKANHPKSDYMQIFTNLKDAGYREVKICATESVIFEAASIDCTNRFFSKGLLFISSKCKLLKGSLLKTRTVAGLRKIDKPTGDTWSHFTDALKYYCFEFSGDYLKRLRNIKKIGI